jgi:deoxyribonuclease V
VWYFLDVDYRGDHAFAAGLGCVGPREAASGETFGTPIPSSRRVVEVAPIAAYEPGAFYKRELPCLLALLADTTPFADEIEALVIDGYVWLGAGRPGLGAHLHLAIGERIPVIGIAKNSFHDNDEATPLWRGESRKPLFVTVVGPSGEMSTVLTLLANLPGSFRLPDMVKLVDHLCRGAVRDLGDSGREAG